MTISKSDQPAESTIVRTHADAGERHGARFRGRGWRAATSLSEMLDRLDSLAERADEVSIERMLNAIGRSSFAPLLLVPGLIVLSPLGGMPGLPSTVACLVGLAAVQILMGRSYFWLPSWLLNRSISSKALERCIRFMRPLARITEKLFRSRMRWMTGAIGSKAVVAMCLAICVVMPPLEVIPMANSMCGAALALFGLALTTRDGVLTMIAFALTLCAAAAILMSIF